MSRTTPALIGMALALAACDRPATMPDPAAPGISVAPDGMTNEVNTSGLERSSFPSDNPGPPYYARLEPTLLYTADGWAVVPFYRDPTCIPPGFNLLSFFDVPAAFGCTLQVEGFNLSRRSAPPGPPWMIETRGTGAVPFWFIPEDEVLSAMGDGFLTIVELAGLPGLMEGSATRFEEVLQPIGGSQPVPKLVLTASGTLASGGWFEYHVTAFSSQIQATGLNFRY